MSQWCFGAPHRASQHSPFTVPSWKQSKKKKNGSCAQNRFVENPCVWCFMANGLKSSHHICLKRKGFEQLIKIWKALWKSHQHLWNFQKLQILSSMAICMSPRKSHLRRHLRNDKTCELRSRNTTGQVRKFETWDKIQKTIKTVRFCSESFRIVFLVVSFGPVSWSRSRGATAIVGVEVVNAGIVHSRQCLIDSSSSKSQLYYYVVRVCFRSCDQLWPCKNLQNTMAQQSRRFDHI